MFDIEKLPFYDFLPVGTCSFNALKDELIPCRAVQRIPENAQSVIVYLFPYYLGEEYYENINISKYAVPEDYHKICGKYLGEAVEKLKNDYPGYSFEYFCDNSPINEVKAACLAGLGVKGENTLLINKTYGSFCFIGEVVTDLEIEIVNRGIYECEKCGLCVEKCINSAIKCGKINKDNCLSHITQKKNELTADEVSLIKQSGCIWGCDICQDVCPMNKKIAISPIKEFYKTAKATYECFSDYKENRAFSWRKQDVIERNLRITKKP